MSLCITVCNFCVGATVCRQGARVCMKQTSHAKAYEWRVPRQRAGLSCAMVRSALCCSVTTCMDVTRAPAPRHNFTVHPSPNLLDCEIVFLLMRASQVDYTMIIN